MPGQPDPASPDGGRPRPLAKVAQDAAEGRASAAELHEAFLAATVYCEAGDKPGFQAVGRPGAGLIPVFTSEVELARARGAVAWFSTTGADLLGLLPEGYDIGLDLAGETPLRLRPSALRPVVEVSWG